MGKSRGRPKSPDGTRQVKLFSDLADMISWIVTLANDPKVTAASLVDPLLRPQIVARYERVRPQVERIKKAQAEAQKAGEE
jgi:hypothetical protein